MDLHSVGLGLFTLITVISLLLVVGKPLGKEFEATALVWIRAWKRIQAERRKPFTDELHSPQSRPVKRLDSK